MFRPLHDEAMALCAVTENWELFVVFVSDVRVTVGAVSTMSLIPPASDPELIDPFLVYCQV